MDAAALEQTLRDHPDDQAAWQVYGDWLLERDDVRGALIQLEHRHARARAADRPALRREIDAIVERHRARWQAELPPGVTATAWRHGFPTKVAVTWDEGAADRIEQALRARFVTALRLAAPDAGAEEDEEDDLDEDGVPIPPRVIEIGELAALDLGRLVELDLSYLSIGMVGAQAIAAHAALGRLAALDLRYGRIGDRGLAALAGSALAGRVRRLHLQRNDLTAEGARALGRFERLVELDLRYNELGAEGARALLEAPFIGALERLALYRTDVSEAGARALARSDRLAPALRGYWRTV